MKHARDRLCLALDVPSLPEAETIVSELVAHVGYFKVGLQLYTAEGPRAITMIRDRGGKVILDLKLHDIPNTVAGAAEAAMTLGVEMITVHAHGGRTMLSTIMQRLGARSDPTKTPRPRVLAITVLTSISEKTLQEELNIRASMREQVMAMTSLALTAGLDGVVASAQEVASIRQTFGPKFVVLTPGIRPSWASAPHDQQRQASPAEAISMGADYIVVGRPILQAANRTHACDLIVNEIAGAKASEAD